MQFLYFLPGWKKTQVTVAELDTLGLGHIHGGHGPTSMAGKFGDLGTGLLIGPSDEVCPPNMGADLRHKPDLQTWQPGPLQSDAADAKPAYFVGYWNDKRPNEASLRRREIIGGASAVLRGGETWTLPLAMAHDGINSLPKVLKMNPATGKWAGQVAPAHQQLAAAASEAAVRLLRLYRREDMNIEYDTAMTVVMMALGLNYRVGPLEVSILELIGDPEIWAVTEAVCDWDSFLEAWAAKMGNGQASGSRSTDSGSEANSPVINPPAATSR